MKKSKMKPSILKTMMIVVITMIIVLLVGGFYFAQIWLSDMSISLNTTSSSNQATTQTNSQSTSQLQNDVASQKNASDKAANMVVSQQKYLDQIKNDLNKYASDTGLTISDYKAATSPETSPLTTPITGIQPNYVSVSLKKPVVYTNLIKFMKAIETNVPKMKLTGINITNTTEPGASVNVEPLIIEVYTR